jgi:hypothetical protein
LSPQQHHHYQMLLLLQQQQLHQLQKQQTQLQRSLSAPTQHSPLWLAPPPPSLAGAEQAASPPPSLPPELECRLLQQLEQPTKTLNPKTLNRSRQSSASNARNNSSGALTQSACW